MPGGPCGSSQLSAGDSVDLQDFHCASPLYVACQNGHVEAACALLSAGANADLRCKLGGSPLLVACLQGHAEAARALLSAGARADLRDINGATPLDLLPTALHPEMERLVQRVREKRTLSSCACCGGAPSAGAKLLACGRCMSVRYCSAVCQAKHWREGGHKGACPWLRNSRARSATGG